MRPRARLAAFVCADAMTALLAYGGAIELLRSPGVPLSFGLVNGVTISLFAPLVFSAGGLYRQVWHLASNAVLPRVLFNTLAVSLGFAFLPDVSASLAVTFGLLFTVLVTVARLVIPVLSVRPMPGFRTRTPCLIYGAGVAGHMLVSHSRATRDFPYRPVGFIDDDPRKRGAVVAGLPVLGGGQTLADAARRLNAAVVIIAIHDATGALVRTVAQSCTHHGLRPLIMPTMADTLSQAIYQVRPIVVKDLLQRSVQSIDRGRIANFFGGRTVLVTGAGGSIGSELCEQIAATRPRRLVMVDSSEYNLYLTDLKLRERLPATEIVTVLGDVTNHTAMNRVFAVHRPSLVLHAAAYKHVPMIEANPISGILNNVLGTRIIAGAAQVYGADRFLLISSDKAVNPPNVMGATKRLCELIVQAMGQCSPADSTRFCAVRFGNVLGSSGSVVPRFLQQIRDGGPVTVTHRDVTRYFMLIEEAVGLVLQAVTMANGNETFILNMGDPIRIYDMAEQLIRLSGKVPGRDIEVRVTGMRPGEKLYEELILVGNERATMHEDILVAIPGAVDPSAIFSGSDQLLDIARNGDAATARALLFQLIREPGTDVPPLGRDPAQESLGIGYAPGDLGRMPLGDSH